MACNVKDLLNITMPHFASIELAPADPILGLNEAFAKDTRTGKINLGVGIFKDTNGATPVLNAVKKAEAFLLSNEKTKNYLPIEGAAVYGKLVGELLFGADSAILVEGRSVTAHTPGGTGALRVTADFLARTGVAKKVWLSDPTWPNHPQIFQAAGLSTSTYRYFDGAKNRLDFEGFIAALKAIPSGDAVVFHGCCHNPSGADPAPDQWRQIAEITRERNLLPLIDFAYQGFGSGLREDAACLEAFTAIPQEIIICSSFSKNFGLYNERVGALTIVTADAKQAQCVLSQVKGAIRANYSNPASHGGAVVSTILSDAALRSEWEAELAAMRERINGMRSLFVDTLKSLGVNRDFSFIRSQRGMFSFSGLNKDQVTRLKDEYAVYIVGSGRINVAGMTPSNMDHLCKCIASVL